MDGSSVLLSFFSYQFIASSSFPCGSDILRKNGYLDSSQLESMPINWQCRLVHDTCYAASRATSVDTCVNCCNQKRSLVASLPVYSLVVSIDFLFIRCTEKP